MITHKGQGVSAGLGLAPALILKQFSPNFSRLANSAEQELKLFTQAKAQASVEIRKLKEIVLKRLGPDKAEIFEAHLMMLEDPELGDSVTIQIQQGMTAEKAVYESTESLAQIFAQMDDAYMREREADIRDIGLRLIRILNQEESQDLSLISEPRAVVATELSPSQAGLLNPEFVKLVICERGGFTSHAAILLRNLEIPSVFGVEGATEIFQNSELLAIDGTKGKVFHQLSKEEQQKLRSDIESFEHDKRELLKIKDTPAKTASGTRISLLANIGNIQDAQMALERGAEGVGLFRTEFLFMEATSAPTEQHQFDVYKKILEIFSGKKVVIRTLDIGGDKEIPYMKLPKEENPFLGLRGLRLCLKQPEIFLPQLRALIRASAFGNLHIMFPMVTNLSEVLEVKALIQKTEKELKDQGQKVGSYKVGIMIEVPSVALMVEQLAPHIDFASIGTNDLTQYTLAVDRMNPGVSSLYDSTNPGFLNIMRTCVGEANKHKLEISICGEMGGQLEHIPFLIDIGLRQLSMTPVALLPAKRFILAH